MPDLIQMQADAQEFWQQDGPLLVIQPLVGIGDMVWHKPWIDQLIETQDVYLVTKMASHPQVLFSTTLPKQKIIAFDRNIRGVKGRHDGPLGLWRLARDFKKTGARRALFLHHSSSLRLALSLAGINHVAGFGLGKNKGLTGAQLSRDDKQIHATQRMKKFWDINGWTQPEKGWHIDVDVESKRHGLARLKDDKIVPTDLLIFGIGAMHEDRCWPANRFADVIADLQRTRPDLVVGLMGGPAERPIAEEIQTHLRQNGHAPAYEIFTNLAEAIAILSIAKGYVGNDTSLLNIAAVLGRPSLGLFSQSPPLTYVPTLHHLDVIKKQDYGQPGIIRQITSDDVREGIEALWPHHS